MYCIKIYVKKTTIGGQIKNIFKENFMNNLANFCGANVGDKNFQENYVKGATFDCETYTKCDKIERQPKTKRGNFKNIMLDKTKDNSNSFSILAGRGMSDNIDDKNFADLGDFPLAKSLAKTMRAREENVKFTPKIILDKIYNRRKNMHKKIASKSILANENCSNFEVGKISNFGVNNLADFKMEDCSTGEANEILNCEASGVLTGEANEVLNVGVDAVSSVGGKSAFGYGITGGSDLKTDEISAIGTCGVPSMANVGSTEDGKNLDKVSDCVVNIDILVDSKKKSENSYGSVGKSENPYGRVGRSEEMYGRVGKPKEMYESAGKSEEMYGSVGKSEEMYGSVQKSDVLVENTGKSENLYGSVGKPEEMYESAGKSDVLVENTGKSENLYGSVGKSENLYGSVGKPDEMYGSVGKSEEMYGSVGKPEEMYESVQKSDDVYENSKNIQIFETPTNVGCEEDLYSPKLSDRFLGMSGLSTIVLRSPEAVYGEGVEVSDDRTRLRVDGITSFGDDGMGLGALRHELGKITLDGGFYTSSDRMGKISTDENNVDFSEKNEQNLNKDNKKIDGQNLEIQNGVTQNVENQRGTSPNIENLKSANQSIENQNNANQPIEGQGSASKKDYANDDLGKSLVIGMKVGEIGFGSVPEDVRKCELLNMKINRRDSENWTHKEWIKFFIKVEPCIAMCVKHFDNMFYRASVLSLDYNECAKFGSVENMFNELIELTERKKQYLKLKFFINRLKKELDEYDLMIIGYFVFDEDTRSALLEEMSRRTIYRRANRIFTKLTNFLVARGYTEKWLYKQFGMLTR